MSGNVTVNGLADQTGTLVFVPGTGINGLTDGAGNYTLLDVPVGTYSVAAQRPGFAYVKVENVVVNAAAATTAPRISVIAPAGGPGGFATLSGRTLVGSCENKPVSSPRGGIPITAKTLDGTVVTATSTADGSWTMQVPGAWLRLSGPNGLVPGFSGTLTASPYELAAYAGETATRDIRATLSSCSTARKGLVITRISYLSSTAAASNSVTVRNTSSATIDLNKALVSFEYTLGATLAMQHLRFGQGKTLASGAEFTFYDHSGCSDGSCVKQEAGLGGTGSANMGLNGVTGSLVIYTNVTTASDINTGNINDYLQYARTPSDAPSILYTHANEGVSLKLWSDASKSFAPAPPEGKGIVALTVGATDSLNWAVQ
jgi:hypothetical protein